MTFDHCSFFQFKQSRDVIVLIYILNNVRWPSTPVCRYRQPSSLKPSMQYYEARVCIPLVIKSQNELFISYVT